MGNPQAQVLRGQSEGLNGVVLGRESGARSFDRPQLWRAGQVACEQCEEVGLNGLVWRLRSPWPSTISLLLGQYRFSRAQYKDYSRGTY